MLDMSSFDNALKVHYTDETVANLTYQDHPWLAMIPKDQKMGGKSKFVPLIFGNPQNRSADFATAQAGNSNSLLAGFNITRKKDYSIAKIDNETIEASESDADAFMDAATTEIDGALGAISGSLSTDIFRKGTGTIGTIGAISGAVATLANVNDVVHFEVGMVQQFTATDGGALRTAGASLTVIAVDRDAGKVTYSAGIVATLSDVVVGDCIVPKGDLNAKVKGMDAWCPLTAPTSGDNFFGEDRSVDPTRLAGIRLNRIGANIDEALVDGLARAARERANPDLALLDTSNFAALEKALGAKVQYVDVKSDVGVGFTGIQIIGQKRKVTVMSDPDMFSDRCYIVQKNTWKLNSLGQAPKILMTDGLKFLRSGTADSVEVRCGYYGQVSCNAPGYNLVLQLA
jgi:hypothetical protein